MFSNGSSGDKVFYPWSSDISAFLLSQCAVAFRHSLSSGCKVSPARWLVRASAQIGLNRPQSHQCCFPTPFVSDFGRIPSCKHISALWRICWSKFEDCTEVPTNPGQKNICPRRKKRKKVSTFHVQKVPTPHHFSNGPYLLQQDAESDDEE